MQLERLISRVTEELDTALKDISDAEREAIKDIVKRAMMDSSTRTTRELKESAMNVIGHEADLAHKIQAEMDKKKDMLIANLSGMC